MRKNALTWIITVLIIIGLLAILFWYGWKPLAILGLFIIAAGFKKMQEKL